MFRDINIIYNRKMEVTSANTLSVDKKSFLNHLCKLKGIKSQIHRPVVQQQKLVPMMSIDHLALLIGICSKESFETPSEIYLLY